MVVMDWVVFLREVWASVSLLLIFDRDLRNSIRSRKDERSMSQKLLLLLLLKKVVYRFRRIVSLVEKFKNESIVLRSIHSDISFDNNRGINGDGEGRNIHHRGMTKSITPLNTSSFLIVGIVSLIRCGHACAYTCTCTYVCVCVCVQFQFIE